MSGPDSLAPRWRVRLLIGATALLALLPLGRLAMNWWTVEQVVDVQLGETPPRGSVGVRWTDADEGIVAAYVFPPGPAYEQGFRDGDRLVELDYQPFFAADDVEGTVQRATGVVLAITGLRGDASRTLDVPVAEDPTFLYPLSAALWTATGWGFALVTLVHVLALASVRPLARRARRAQGAAALITAALVWVGGNLVRHLWVTLAGYPSLDGPLAMGVFDALTLLALAGWIAFPALLIRRSLVDDRWLSLASRGARWALWVPPLVLGGTVTWATLTGHIGPLPPDALVGPILFYVCVYVAAATGLTLAWTWRQPTTKAGIWSRAASAFVMVLALAGALFVYNALPAFEDRVTAGWFVVALQLFSLLPVLLVSASTLQYGRFRTLVARSFATGAALAAVFVFVVLGAVVMRALGLDVTGSGPVALGVWTVVLLLLADWLSPAFRRFIARVVQSDRQRARLSLDRLGEGLRRLDSVEALAQTTAKSVGHAVGARSAVVFLRETDGESWVREGFRPEPPHFTVVELERAWDELREGGGVWSRNAELDETDLPDAISARLRGIGVALAVPVVGTAGEPAGLIAVSRKERRLAVYNVEEVEALKSLAAQLALATDRLALLERERQLVRRTAEAELAALRAQISPHFLFNALNTIAALIAEKPDEAEATVETLAGLFRDVLTSSGKRFVPLSAEMRLVKRYLAIEKARFGARLDIRVDVPDDLRDVPVPAFAVQTLVENAVKHGIEGKRGGGAVRIEAREAGDTAEVTVADTGVGIPALFASGDGAAPHVEFYGVGLSNVSDRLRQLYGDDHHLSIRSSPEGTAATLLLPLS
ncbi:MAG: histidine kinase [Bacteroidota bacterium]